MDAKTGVAMTKPKLPKLPLPEGRLSEEKFRALDRVREALTAQATGGLSPASLAMAFMDWSIHLASAPGKCLELTMKAGQKAARLGAHIAAAGLEQVAFEVRRDLDVHRR